MWATILLLILIVIGFTSHPWVTLFALLLLGAIVYKWPLVPLTYYGRAWGRRVTWTAGLIAAGFPRLPRGVHVRVSRVYFLFVRPITLIIGSNPGAMTLGRTIISSGPVTAENIRHELQHVQQWEQRGWYAASAAAEEEAEKAELTHFVIR